MLQQPYTLLFCKLQSLINFSEMFLKNHKVSIWGGMRVVALIFKINLYLTNVLNYTSKNLTGYLHCQYCSRWDLPLSPLGASCKIIPVQQSAFTRFSNFCSVPHRPAAIRQTCLSSSVFCLWQGQHLQLFC